MTTIFKKVIKVLSEKNYHDDISIGLQLNIAPEIVRKVIKKLETYGIAVKFVKSKGYFLENPLVLLDPKIIQFQLKHKVKLTIHEKIGSTNDYLKKSISFEKSHVCIAETQTKGRGRLNRSWHSPFGQNIYLSLRYSFQKELNALQGLSLIVGLAVCHAVEKICKLDMSLAVKWPNDIMANGKKLAGILLDIQAQSHGLCTVIIGIGLNANMKKALKAQITQDWISLYLLTNQTLDRNILAAEIINQLIDYLERFNQSGLPAFADEWQSRDYLLNQPVSLSFHETIISGKGSGINSQGHLVLTPPGNIKQSFASGDAVLLK